MSREREMVASQRVVCTHYSGEMVSIELKAQDSLLWLCGAKRDSDVILSS